MENAKKYFDRYGKLKRTYEALSTLTKETFAELSHLESVSNALEIARDENDLAMNQRRINRVRLHETSWQKSKKTSRQK